MRKKSCRKKKRYPDVSEKDTTGFEEITNARHQKNPKFAPML